MTTARISALVALGDYRRFLPELRATVAEAKAADNRTALLQLAVNETIADELQGRPEVALARIKTQRDQLPAAGRFALLHAVNMIAVGRITCRTEDYDWGVPLFETDVKRFLAARSSDVLVAAARGVRARLWLNREGSMASASTKKIVATEVEALSRIAAMRVQVSSLRARVAFLQGDRRAALEILQAALQNTQGSLLSDVDVQRHALGLLRADAEGERLCADSERALLEAGVVDPKAYIRSFYPELFRERAGLSPASG